MAAKRESPGIRMKRAGYKPVQLWLTGGQYDDAFEAAEYMGLPLTQVFIRGGLKLAEKKLSEKRKIIAKKT